MSIKLLNIFFFILSFCFIYSAGVHKETINLKDSRTISLEGTELCLITKVDEKGFLMHTITVPKSLDLKNNKIFFYSSQSNSLDDTQFKKVEDSGIKSEDKGDNKDWTSTNSIEKDQYGFSKFDLSGLQLETKINIKADFVTQGVAIAIIIGIIVVVILICVCVIVLIKKFLC